MINNTDLVFFTMRFEALIDAIGSYIDSGTVDLINSITWMIYDRTGLLPRSVEWAFGTDVVLLTWTGPTDREYETTVVSFSNGICVFLHDSVEALRYTVSELRYWDGSTPIRLIEEIVRIHEEVGKRTAGH